MCYIFLSFKLCFGKILKSNFTFRRLGTDLYTSTLNFSGMSYQYPQSTGSGDQPPVGDQPPPSGQPPAYPYAYDNTYYPPNFAQDNNQQRPPTTSGFLDTSEFVDMNFDALTDAIGDGWNMTDSGGGGLAMEGIGISQVRG